MPENTEKTQEQLIAEAAEKARVVAETKAREKAEKKAAADKVKADAKAKREADAQAKKDAKVTETQAKKDKAAADKQAKVDAKAAALKAKEDAKQPEQNGIRRPGPEGKCGKAWALMDAMSAKKGAPVAVADYMLAAKASGMNENMARSNYAAWRKFNGVTGRVLSESDIAKAKAVEQAAQAAAALKAAETPKAA